MTAKELNETMWVQHSYISYDPQLADSFLKSIANIDVAEDDVPWLFVDYLLSQDLADEVVE